MCTQINELRAAFENGTNPLDDPEFAVNHSTIHAVAGVLKLYLRLLPNPVFSRALFDSFMEVRLVLFKLLFKLMMMQC